MRLEYRLDNEDQQYPALWYYPDLITAEVVGRMTCEYLVKEGETYSVTATAMEPDGTVVIYLKRESFVNNGNDPLYSHIGFEVRELEDNITKLIEKNEVWEHEEILPILHLDILFIKKEQEFLEFILDSREIDEDRKCYVYYGKFTGKRR